MVSAVVILRVILGYVAVHDYTVIYFHTCYRVNLEQDFQNGLFYIRFSKSRD
jgi:hypothetical protein